jgi:dihydroflavonol-4-reductase
VVTVLASCTMTTFITGATGFIGRHLVPLLLSRGESLRCLVRPTSDAGALREAGVELVEGDVTDPASLRGAVSGCRRVIHLANRYSLWERDPTVLRRINVDGTRAVLEVAREARVELFLHVSTVAVFGSPEQQPFDESTPVAASRASEYARTKYEGDLLVEECAAAGLPVVYAFPAAVLGPGDPQATGQYIADVVRGRMPVGLFGDAVLTAVHVRDVASAIATLVARPDLVGQRFIIGREEITIRDFNSLIAEVAGVRAPWPYLPGWAGLLSAALLTGISRITRCRPPWGLSLDLARTIAADVRADGSRAEGELGLTYTPIRQAVEEAVQALRDGR